MNVSIVIPTFNSENTLKECLESFKNQTYPPHEIIIVDRKSADSTAEITKSFDNAQLLICEKSGPGPARNLGVEKATGDLIFFSDSDCVADNEVLEHHLKVYESRNDIDGVMGSIHNGNPKNKISEFVQREIMASQWLRSLRPDGTVKYFHTGTYNFSIHRNVFLKWKFKEDPLLSEDTELSIRVSNELKIIFEPRARVFHRHPSTVKELFKQRKKYGELFPKLLEYSNNTSFAHDTLRFSALRFLKFPEDYLARAILKDNRLLCKECKIKNCKMDSPNLGKEVISDKYLCRVVCLAFASGILKQRTSLEYNWN